MLAQREESRRGERESRRREEEEEAKERISKSTSRREDSLSQSMNRGPKLSLAPHRILPRTDLRCKMQCVYKRFFCVKTIAKQNIRCAEANHLC